VAMGDSELFFALLRISATQALRAAGLTTAKPAVLDTITDILARYLILLGTTTRDIAESSGRSQAELADVRCALEDVGALRPLNIYGDPGDDDDRAVLQLVEWFRGPQAAEMRRVAGFAANGGGGGREGAVVKVDGGGGAGGRLDGEVKNDEWLAALKKIAEKRMV